jgi:hypothetical protein
MLTDLELGFFVLATPTAWALGFFAWPEHTSLFGMAFGTVVALWAWLTVRKLARRVLAR